MLQTNDVYYRPVSCAGFISDCQENAFRSPQEYMTVRNILGRNCLGMESLTSRLNNADQQEFKYRRDDLSLNPERALWNNNYQIPSDQKLNGLLAILAERDVA